MAADDSTFPLFSNLPLELRDQIWQESMPEVEQALFFYKRGCWQPRYLTAADEGYDPTNEERNLEFGFHPEHLDAVHVDVPLYSVNSEARRNVLAWIGKQERIEMHHLPDERSLPIFARKFDLELDVLYVPLHKWHDFLVEADEQPFLLGLLDRPISESAAYVRRLALPTELFQSAVTHELVEILSQRYCLVRLLFVISDSPQRLYYVDTQSTRIQRLWGLKEIGQEAATWERDDHCFKIVKDGGNRDASEFLRRVFGQENQRLAEALAEVESSISDIKLASAVRG